MKPGRLMIFATIFVAAMAVLAQQPRTKTAANPGNNFPSVDAQMKILTEKLDLTAEQQSKIRPIMQDLHDYTISLLEDKSLTQQQRLDKVRPRRVETGQKIRELLTEAQNAKFDAYLKGPHGEMHGGLSGGAAEAPHTK